MKTITFNDSQKCFENAINAGFLSTDKNSEVYAGNYMYMYSIEQVNYFKHSGIKTYVSFINI